MGLENGQAGPCEGLQSGLWSGKTGERRGNEGEMILEGESSLKGSDPRKGHLYLCPLVPWNCPSLRIRGWDGESVKQFLGCLGPDVQAGGAVSDPGDGMSLDVFWTVSLVSREGTGTHSSTLAWKIPWTEEPGRLQSMWSLRVRHD